MISHTIPNIQKGVILVSSSVWNNAYYLFSFGKSFSNLISPNNQVVRRGKGGWSLTPFLKININLVIEQYNVQDSWSSTFVWSLYFKKERLCMCKWTMLIQKSTIHLNAILIEEMKSKDLLAKRTSTEKVIVSLITRDTNLLETNRFIWLVFCFRLKAVLK